MGMAWQYADINAAGSDRSVVDKSKTVFLESATIDKCDIKWGLMMECKDKKRGTWIAKKLSNSDVAS